MPSPLEIIRQKKNSAVASKSAPSKKADDLASLVVHDASVGSGDRSEHSPPHWPPHWLATIEPAAILAGFGSADRLTMPTCPQCGSPCVWVSILPVVISPPGQPPPSPVRVRCAGCDPPKFSSLVRLWLVAVKKNSASEKNPSAGNFAAGCSADHLAGNSAVSGSRALPALAGVGVAMGEAGGGDDGRGEAGGDAAGVGQRVDGPNGISEGDAVERFEAAAQPLTATAAAPPSWWTWEEIRPRFLGRRKRR